MVSIPDWSRFGRLGEASREPPPGQKYYKQQAEEIVKQAEEHGYFANPSRSFIEEKFLPDAERKSGVSFLDEYHAKRKDLSRLRMMKLIGAHLRTVGDIGLCYNLRICTLSNNYITRFEGLVSCAQLIKLDLHGNHITMLPPPAFWESMHHLKILHLHDNPIGKIDNLHYLGGCAQLAALTMYDTPLSLKRNYRHHVVNSVWTLRALDNIVVSDEEIIEDAEFGGMFAAFHPMFAIELCPPLPQSADYSTELEQVYQVLREISHIQAHHSPVILIQRYIRGFLVRRAYRMLQQARFCNSDAGAAVTLQRRYRRNKGLDTPHAVDIPPPPSSPVTDKRTPGGAPDALKLDYDTYLRQRRPGSTGFSETSASSRLSRQLVGTDRNYQVTGDVPSVPANSAKSDPDGIPHGRKNIFINLAKLQSGTLQGLQVQDEALTITTMLGTSDVTMATRGEESSRQPPQRQPCKKREPEKKRKVIKNVKQFFGPMVENAPTPEPEGSSHTDEEEIPKISFRLKGVHHRIRYYDPIANMIITRREAGREVREAEEDFHNQQKQQLQQVAGPKPKRLTQRQNSDQRMLARVQGSMGFSCLHAIQQAYKEREQTEKRAARLEYVLGIREDRDAAKDRIRRFQDQKRATSLKEREQDQKRLVDMLERREALRLKYLDKSQDKRSKSSHHTKQRRGELTFIGEFNTQNTSVANALLRHDRQARTEDNQQDKSEKVKTVKDMTTEQKQLVKKYMEHRQLMRQTETAMSRATLDTHMLQEANDRLLEARTRLAQQKARSAHVETFYPLPNVSTHSMPLGTDHGESATPAEMGDLKGMDRWNTSMMTSHGRVGQHPTSVV